MSTENIVKFLQTNYSDEQLAALLAHAQDGKLEFESCCCLIGIPTADHVLQSYPEDPEVSVNHYMRAKRLHYALAAEIEFLLLGGEGEDRHELRRQRLIPLILAEMDRRHQHTGTLVSDLTRAVRGAEINAQIERHNEEDDLGDYGDPANEPYAGVRL